MADDKNTSLLTQPQQIRIELLKLVHRHDRKAEDAIAKAVELEQYVTGEAAVPASLDGQGEPDTPV
jgi:hypothetical protein